MLRPTNKFVDTMLGKGASDIKQKLTVETNLDARSTVPAEWQFWFRRWTPEGRERWHDFFTDREVPGSMIDRIPLDKAKFPSYGRH